MTHSEKFFQRGIRLSHLRLLTMFAELGQVRLVAERLNVTQPAVSKQLAELELGLGTPVLKRAGNRLQFTPVGESLLQRAREVLLQLEQARRDLDALRSGLSGTLAVGAVATVLPVVAPELTLRIKQRIPNVSFTFFEATSDRLYPMLAAGALDMVFSRVPPVSARPEFVAEPMFDDPIVLVCGRHNPLASRRELTPDDLKGLLWILPPREAPAFLALNNWAERHGLSFPQGCVQSISLSVNATLLRKYPFVGLMPKSLAYQEDISVLRLPRASFLGKVRLFHRKTTANPVMHAALQYIPEIRNALVTRR
ncbi:LysR family transcriptional regulator [Bradyrhizobium diazoefficiens]|nr:LysR family transcriptional regulator [Bradyrhizobium diazoefficiens]QQO20611.1 LysR family transcriptional regulator [Bradyrhizobium diazoefficiens]